MASKIMMGLGAYRFSIYTAAYQSLTRETDFGMVAVPRAANFPAYQNPTLGADAIELRGVIYPSYRGGIGQIEAMRASGRARVPLPLVNGRGQWLGTWVIMKVSELSTVFLSDGPARKMEFGLSLEFAGNA